MPTNPQAEGQTRINFQISEDEKASLQRLANRSGMKLSAYIRAVLTNAIYAPITFKTNMIIQEPDEQLDVAAEPPPAPYGVKAREEFVKRSQSQSQSQGQGDPPPPPAPSPSKTPKK